MKKKSKGAWRGRGGQAARLLLLCLGFALGACKSAETGNLFNTGRDAREYNPITRQYEWPDQRRRP